MFLLPLCCLAVDMTICSKSLIPSRWDAGVLYIAERLRRAAELPRWCGVEAPGQNHLLTLHRQECGDQKLIEDFCGLKVNSL